ncbi:MAG TPA: shikimate kinase AroK [Gammaproteobacteria bacterium]|nr:shikimate kinase AroK [Gammaproteobacteria bacterium]
MNSKHKNIFLIGPMGAGKSSVGKFLAAQLNMDFYDTDEEIEKRTGVDIGWIFDVEGEMGFRKREEAVVDDLAHLSNIVLATGGGTVLSPESRIILQNNGMVVYLEVSLRYQQVRTVNESRRPLLRVENRQEVLEKLQMEREALYQEIADFRVLTDKKNVKAVSDEIIDWLGGVVN